MSLPLAGVRVVAVEQYGAGPYGTAHLADLGADVIKVENRAAGGDMARGVGPYFLGEGDSEFFQAFNRNKRSLSLDLKRPEGQEVLHRLVATADALLDNLRGDKPERLGITYAQLAPHNPRLVCCHLSAYGRDGPRRGWPGYDFLMQAEAGFLSVTGEPGSPPARFGLSMVDYMGGMTAAFALVSGILSARATGAGRDVDVSLFDVAMHQLSYPGVWYLNEGLETGRVARSGHPYIVPSQLYRTKDGWIFFMCQTQRFWERLCELVGRADLLADPAYADYAGRHAHRDRLTEILDETLSARTTAEWLEVLGGEVPAAPVNTLAQALDNPFFRERGGVLPIDHPDRPGLATIAGPVRLGEPRPARPGSRLGADTEAILAELGYDEAAIARLRDAGTI